MKRLVLSKKEICTVPNLLTLIRILLVPVYMTLLILASPQYNQLPTYCTYIAFGIMLLASFTDVLDGKIARRFNQGSYVGQLVDPIADKCMHIGAIVALAIARYLHWAFIIFIAFREFMMVFVGSFVVNKVNIKANMLGKVASAIISVGVMCCFFHSIVFEKLIPGWSVYTMDWVIVTIGLALNWAAAVNYAIGVVKSIKQDKENAANEELTEEATAVASDETDAQ